jgi:hypothetical protein
MEYETSNNISKLTSKCQDRSNAKELFNSLHISKLRVRRINNVPQHEEF